MPASFIIFVSAQSWHIAKVEGGNIATSLVKAACGWSEPIVAAGAVYESLSEQGYRGEPALLALPSSVCLCAAIDIRNLRARGKETAMQFKLEEQIPLAAEEVVSDFIALSARSSALGVSVAVQWLEPILQALEDAGVAVACISPAAILLARQVLADTADPDRFDLLAASFEDRVEWFELTAGKISGWQSFPPDADLVRCNLRQLSLRLERAVRLLCNDYEGSPAMRVHEIAQPSSQPKANGDTQGDNAADPGNFLEPEMGGLAGSTPPLELASRAAGSILSGSAKPPIDLRRPPLAPFDTWKQLRIPLRAAAVAAILLCLSLAATLLWRSHQYDRLADAAVREQTQIFHQAFPEQTVPASIKWRLASEHKRLQGLSGMASTLPPNLSVLPMLHDILAAMPPRLRFRIVELRLEPMGFYMEGQTLTHGDADQIATALKLNTSLQIDPPHTDQAAGEDVNFVLTGSLAVQSSDIQDQSP